MCGVALLWLVWLSACVVCCCWCGWFCLCVSVVICWGFGALSVFLPVVGVGVCLVLCFFDAL